MNTEEELILNKYFDFRQEVFARDVNSIESLEQIINEKVAESLKGSIDKPEVLALSSALLHYRELCGLNKVKPNLTVVSSARSALQKYVNEGIKNIESTDGKDAIFYSIASYANAMSFHLFYLGTAHEVYNILLSNDGFVEYFNGANMMFKYFEQTKIFNNYCGISNEFLYETIRQEVYGVWTYYQSISYMPLVLFLYFLNSDISFDELEEENKKRLSASGIKLEHETQEEKPAEESK